VRHLRTFADAAHDKSDSRPSIVQTGEHTRTQDADALEVCTSCSKESRRALALKWQISGHNRWEFHPAWRPWLPNSIV